MEPERAPAFVLPTSAITRKRPGMGKLLSRLGMALMFSLPMAIFIVSAALRALSMTLPPLVEAFLGLSAVAVIFLSPVLVAIGAALSAISLPIAAPGMIRIEKDALVIVRHGREQYIPRASIVGGIVIPGTFPQYRKPKVTLYLRGGSELSLEMPDGLTGHRLLSRLEIAPEFRRVSVALGSPNRELGVGCASIPVATMLWMIPLGYFASHYPLANWPVMMFFFGISCSVLLAMRLGRSREVVIGSDGLSIQKALTKMWIPFSDIRNIDEGNNALYVDRVNPNQGSTRTLVAKGAREVILALGGRIRVAMALGSKGEGGEMIGAEIDPKGKPFAAWKAKLESMLSGAGYRNVTLSPDALYSVLEDPDTAPGQRIGAAMALRIAGHPDAPRRIRIAAQACADDGMKQALEEAATGELEEKTMKRALG